MRRAWRRRGGRARGRTPTARAGGSPSTWCSPALASSVPEPPLLADLREVVRGAAVPLDRAVRALAVGIGVGYARALGVAPPPGAPPPLPAAARRRIDAFLD